MRNFWFEKDGEFISISANSRKEAQAIFDAGGVSVSETEITPEYKLLFGLEIETEYNRDKLGTIILSGYHDNTETHKLGTTEKPFFLETDGSLAHLKFLNGGTFEAVSIPVEIDRVPVILEEFQKGLFRRAKINSGAINPELDEILNFNRTTGAHVHFSLLVKNGVKRTIYIRDTKVSLDGYIGVLKDFVSIDFLHKFTKKFKARIKKELPEIYEDFKRYYFRDYAKRITQNSQRDRYSEFNLRTPYNTIEFRSSHLRGVKTWTQFFKYYKILTESAQEIFDKEFNKSKPFEVDSGIQISIDDSEIRTESEEITIDTEVQ